MRGNDILKKEHENCLSKCRYFKCRISFKLILIQACTKRGIPISTNKCESYIRVRNDNQNIHIVLLTPDYTRRLLSTDPIYVQTIAILDILLVVEKTTYAIKHMQ